MHVCKEVKNMQQTCQKHCLSHMDLNSRVLFVEGDEKTGNRSSRDLLNKTPNPWTCPVFMVFLDSSCFVSQRSCRREPQVYFLLWMSLRNLYYVSRLFSWRGSLDCMSCYSSSSYLLAPSVVASSYCKYKGCPSSTVSVSVVSVMHDLIIIIICSQSILNNFRVQWLKEENSPHLALLFFVPFWGSRSQVISKPSLFKQHWFRES